MSKDAFKVALTKFLKEDVRTFGEFYQNVSQRAGFSGTNWAEVVKNDFDEQFEIFITKMAEKIHEAFDFAGKSIPADAERIMLAIKLTTAILTTHVALFGAKSMKQEVVASQIYAALVASGQSTVAALGTEAPLTNKGITSFLDALQGTYKSKIMPAQISLGNKKTEVKPVLRKLFIAGYEIQFELPLPMTPLQRFAIKSGYTAASDISGGLMALRGFDETAAESFKVKGKSQELGVLKCLNYYMIKKRTAVKEKDATFETISKHLSEKEWGKLAEMASLVSLRSAS